MIEQRYICKMEIDCGRMGRIIGAFICDNEEFNRLVGSSYSFYDVLGKHSEISGTFDLTDFALTECSEDVLNTLVELEIFPIGLYPFDFIID